jgi:hypothetical protein
MGSHIGQGGCIRITAKTLEKRARKQRFATDYEVDSKVAHRGREVTFVQNVQAVAKIRIPRNFVDETNILDQNRFVDMRRCPTTMEIRLF